MSDRYDMAFNLDNMVPGPAGTSTPKTIFKSEDGILISYGTSVPADEATGYAPGCLFLHVDGGDGTALYVNEGTAASADFNAVTVA